MTFTIPIVLPDDSNSEKYIREFKAFYEYKYPGEIKIDRTEKSYYLSIELDQEEDILDINAKLEQLGLVPTYLFYNNETS